MPSRVPLELSDEIINYLSDDKEALKACSLASRNFTTVSQKLIFSCIVIRAPSPANPSTQPHSHVWDLGGSPLKLQVLFDTSPHIADYIECLQMVNVGPLLDHQLDMYNNSLPRILPYINKLKALIICGLHKWDYFSQEAWSSILRLFQLPSLIHLDLSAAPYLLLDNALGPNIKHLCIRHDTDFNRHFFSVATPSISSPIYLDSLMIHDRHWSSRREEFSRMKLSNLRKLMVQEVWCDLNGPGTGRLLQLCGDSLEELTIVPQLDEMADIDEYDSESVFDLSKLSNLRLLITYLRLLVPNKSLETFVIRFAPPNETVQFERDWELVFLLLLDDTFPCLKTLTILITADEGRDVTRWYGWFNGSKYVKTLRSKRGINVEVLVKTDLGNIAPLQFACDVRWECVACGVDRKDLVANVPGLRRPVHLTVILD